MTTQSLPDPVLNLASPKSDADFFAIGRWLLSRSTCLKTQTAALIVDKDAKIISWGANMCCPQGQLYGLPVSECPRMNIQTGGKYELCMPIHAEVVACINAFGISAVERKNLWHFPGFTLRLKRFEGFFKGAKLYLVGHYWACDECTDFAKLIGIEEIKFDDLSGGATLKKYRTTNLTHKETNVIDVSGCILEGIVTVRIKPEKINELCDRNQLNRSSVRPFLRDTKPEFPHLYLVEVPAGQEREYAARLKKDSAVEEVELVQLIKSA